MRFNEKRIVTKRKHRLGEIEYPEYRHDDRHLMRNKIICHIGDNKKLSKESLREFFDLLSSDPEIGKSPHKTWLSKNTHMIKNFKLGTKDYYCLTKQGKRLYKHLLTNISEKSTSKSQQRLMGIAYSVKSGKQKIDDIPGDIRQKIQDMVDGMSLDNLKKYASTDHNNLPDKINDNSSLDGVASEYSTLPNIYRKNKIIYVEA